MEANKTKHLIYELDQIAFGNRERNNKRLHDMHQLVDEEISELERIATEYESNKHYIELGKAVEKLFNKVDLVSSISFLDKEYEEQEEQFIDISNCWDFDSTDDLLEWAEGRE